MSRRRAAIVASTGGGLTTSAEPTQTIAVPGSDMVSGPNAQPGDLYFARRGDVGGTMARAYVGLVQDGTSRVFSFTHGGSGADASTWVPALSGYTNTEVDLGSTAQTPAQVRTALLSAMSGAGVTGAVAAGTDSEGRALIDVPGSALVIPPAYDRLDRTQRGMWGFQRDDWGNGSAGQTLNADGNTNVIGLHHLPSPGTGRVIGMYVWGRGGFRPRLTLFSGPAYSTSPSNLTRLADARIPTGLATGEFGVAVFDEPVAINASDNLWVAYHEANGAPTSQGPRFRLQSASPVGGGDFPAAQLLLVDETSDPDETLSLPATYTPTVDSTFAVNIAIGLIFELPESGNYPADGAVQDRIGDQNNDDQHGTQFDVAPAQLDLEGTHHYTDMPGYYQAEIVAARQAINAVQTSGPDREDSLIAWYDWADTNVPSVGTHPLLGSQFMAFDASDEYQEITLATPIEVGSDTLGANAIVSMGRNYVTDSGNALATYNLPVFLDGITGDEYYPNAWIDNRAEWHDHVRGACGISYPEYRTQDGLRGTSTVPVTDTGETWPDPFDTDPTDDSPPAIAIEAFELARSGLASG